MKRHALVLFLGLLLPSLAIQSRTLNLDKLDQDLNKDGWRYTLKINNRGTRSEGCTGQLYWQGVSISPRFHNLQCPLGRYRFVEGKNRWGEHGWILQNEGMLKVSTSGKINATEKKRGWYKGPIKKRATPAFWVQVGRDDMQYWVQPGKLDALATAHGWSQLSAHSMRGQPKG